MNDLPINLVDLGVAGIILLSGLIAFSRGLVREILSIGAWVAAAVATIYGLPHLRDIARGYIKVPLIADAVTGVTIFVVTLLVCAAVSHLIAKKMHASGLGSVVAHWASYSGSRAGRSWSALPISPSSGPCPRNPTNPIL